MRLSLSIFVLPFFSAAALGQEINVHIVMNSHQSAVLNNVSEDLFGRDVVRWVPYDRTSSAIQSALHGMSSGYSEAAIIPLNSQTMELISANNDVLSVYGFAANVKNELDGSLSNNEYGDTITYAILAPAFGELADGNGMDPLLNTLSSFQETWNSNVESDFSIDKKVFYFDGAEFPISSDIVDGYQEFLAKKGCGCGPSSSCSSLDIDAFLEFSRTNNKKPTCPKNPPKG